MSELEVPMAAVDAFVEVTKWNHAEVEDEYIRAIATPVVVAELRRVRDYVRKNAGSIDIYDVATFALQRANDLEGWTS